MSYRTRKSRDKKPRRVFTVPRDTSARGALQRSQDRASARAWAGLVAKNQRRG